MLPPTLSYSPPRLVDELVRRRVRLWTRRVMGLAMALLFLAAGVAGYASAERLIARRAAAAELGKAMAALVTPGGKATSAPNAVPFRNVRGMYVVESQAQWWVGDLTPHAATALQESWIEVGAAQPTDPSLAERRALLQLAPSWWRPHDDALPLSLYVNDRRVVILVDTRTGRVWLRVDDR